MIKTIPALIFALTVTVTANAQVKPGTDANAPLHALEVDYPTPYKPMPKEEIKKILDRVFNYLDAVTPAQMINKQTGALVNESSKIDTNTTVQQGDFRLTSYEWGVTYSGLLLAAETTGDSKYS